MTQIASIRLPGDASRFDYESLDVDRGQLFIAHLGASQIIQVDVRARRVVRTIDRIAAVHGVLVVPARNRVYATATGTNQLVALNESTWAELGRAPTGDYPDGLAYDQATGTVWTTNESAGTETVLDAATLAVRGTVRLGASVGNVADDPPGRQILIDVQSANTLAAVNPDTLRVTRRLPLPGCQHDHGLSVDTADRLAFIVCDGNSALLTVDLDRWQVTATNQVGADPDVLSYDPAAKRLIVAAESGWITIFTLNNRTLAVTGRDHLADGAHDTISHHAYLPIPDGPDGHPHPARGGHHMTKAGRRDVA